MKTANYIAVDEEMTGIMAPSSSSMKLRRKDTKEDMPSDRYEALKEPSQTYSILQLGICLFHQTRQADPEDIHSKDAYKVVSV